jgi:hypothetical protein
MSLIDEFKSPVCFLEKKRVPDGEGGFVTTWQEGAKFSAAIAFDTSIEARAAEKQGVTSVYTIVTDKSVVLEYHDVLKRLFDGKIFRVTSDGDDKYTPASSALDMRQVTAEEWSLPT